MISPANAFAYGIVSNVATISAKYQTKLSSPDVKLKNYVIRLEDTAPIITNTCQEKISYANFGLAPANFKNRLILPFAGAEEILHKPQFKIHIRTKRCLVPATHYFQGNDEVGLKKPYCIHLYKERPFFFAGIWDEWKNALSGEVIQSFALITCPANAMLRSLGISRMPVILTTLNCHTWLRRSIDLTTVKFLMRIFPNDKMDVYPINPDTLKNKSINDISLVKPTGKSLWQLVADIKREEQKRIMQRKAELDAIERENRSKELEKFYASVEAKYGKKV